MSAVSISSANIRLLPLVEERKENDLSPYCAITQELMLSPVELVCCKDKIVDYFSLIATSFEHTKKLAFFIFSQPLTDESFHCPCPFCKQPIQIKHWHKEDKENRINQILNLIESQHKEEIDDRLKFQRNKLENLAKDRKLEALYEVSLSFLYPIPLRNWKEFSQLKPISKEFLLGDKTYVMCLCQRVMLRVSLTLSEEMHADPAFLKNLAKRIYISQDDSDHFTIQVICKKIYQGESERKYFYTLSLCQKTNLVKLTDQISLITRAKRVSHCCSIT